MADTAVTSMRQRRSHALTDSSPPDTNIPTQQNNQKLIEGISKQANKMALTDSDIELPLLENEADPKVVIEDKDISEEEETSLSIALQVFLPYIIAGFGTVGAGIVLDQVQHWEVFKVVSEAFILVPALLGLKGNLEMTLASRLSTQANCGNLDSRTEQWKAIGGNLALTQAQAIVVGFLASMAAMILGWIPQGKFNLQHGLLLCSSSMLTASLASLVLGTVMIVVVLLSRRFRINPDNVATPIAASLGDLTTLMLLSAITTFIYKAIQAQSFWVAPVIIGIFLLLTPLWVWVSVNNKYVNEVIYTGWTPVICAMVISSCGGLILDATVSDPRYHGMAVFQPVINGVGGNLVAVHASRMSTALHRVSKPGVLPDNFLKGCPNIFSSFCGKGISAKTSRVLTAMVIPGHLVFMYFISYMKAGHVAFTIVFALVYLSACMIQVLLLLFIASWMVHKMWQSGDDPDNFAIPYLTAIGDLLGTGLLAAAFALLQAMGHVNANTLER
ncbi:unnamed protein product [Owenia fusiformis]|uniref:Uncharacterized protein n=1 Tax=Owenia fusiformis TaxID=6347 RepID=A0A8J1XFA3_OWEFU|nr:unnamed protein product [Owenia fusiformis]